MDNMEKMDNAEMNDYIWLLYFITIFQILDTWYYYIWDTLLDLIPFVQF